MDSFDELMSEASQRAQEEGTTFDDALRDALAEQSDITEQTDNEDMEPEAEAAVSQKQLVALEDLVQTIRKIVPVRMDAVLTTDAWSDSGEEDYPFEYRCVDPVFAANKRTDMHIAPQNALDALRAGICPITNTEDGYVRIRAASVPDTDLAVTFVICVML